LNHQGIIPDAAVIKKGEKRSNPFREKKRFDSTHFPRGVDSKTEMAVDGGEDDEDPADVIDLADMES
jgi:tRNA pseudouridine38-40 synthase